MSNYVFYCLTLSFATKSHRVFMELVRIVGRYRLRGRMTSGPSRTSEELRRTSFIGLHTCKQMKYILCIMFCRGKMSLSNSSQWKERITLCIMSIVSIQSLVEGLGFLMSVGLAWKLASMQWQLSILAHPLRISLFAVILSSRSKLSCSWLCSW